MNPVNIFQITFSISSLISFSSLFTPLYGNDGNAQNFTWQYGQFLNIDHSAESSISAFSVNLHKDEGSNCHGNVKILSKHLASKFQCDWPSGKMADGNLYGELTGEDNGLWMKIVAHGNKKQILHGSFTHLEATLESDMILEDTTQLWTLRIQHKEDREKLIELRLKLEEVNPDVSEMAEFGDVEEETGSSSSENIVKINLKTGEKLTKLLDATVLHNIIMNGYNSEVSTSIPFLDQRLQITLTQYFQQPDNIFKFSAKLLNVNELMDVRAKYNLIKIDSQIENKDTEDHAGSSKWHLQDKTEQVHIQAPSCVDKETAISPIKNCLGIHMHREQFINQTLLTPHHHFTGEMTQEVSSSGERLTWIHERATSEWHALNYTLKQVFNFSSSGSGWETMLRRSPWFTIFVQATWGVSYLELYEKTFSFFFDQIPAIPTTLFILDFHNYNDFVIKFKFPTLAWQMGLSLKIDEEKMKIKVEEEDLYWPDDPVGILSVTMTSQDNGDWLVQWNPNIHKLQQNWESLSHTFSMVWDALIDVEGKYDIHPMKTIIDGVIGYPLEVFLEKFYEPVQYMSEQLHDIEDIHKLIDVLSENLGVPSLAKIERWCEKMGLHIDFVHNTATLSMEKWLETKSKIQILFEKLLSGTWQRCEDMIELASLIENIYLI